MDRSWNILRHLGRYAGATLMGVPTKGETFAKLIENLRHAQEEAAMMGHLINMQDGNHMDQLLAKGWIGISELLKKMVHDVTTLASRGLQ